MTDDIVKVGRAGFDELFTDTEWHETGILAHDEEVHKVIFCCGLFNEVLVAKGKGIGIHDNGRDALPCYECRTFRSKAGEVIRKAMAPVFHKAEFTGHACDFIKAEVTKEFGTLTFRIEEELQIAACMLQLDEMREDGIQQAFALMTAVYGETAQGILKAAARSDEVQVIVIDAAGVVKIFIPTDALFGKQCIDLLQGLGIGRVYF